MRTRSLIVSIFAVAPRRPLLLVLVCACGPVGGASTSDSTASTAGTDGASDGSSTTRSSATDSSSSAWPTTTDWPPSCNNDEICDPGEAPYCPDDCPRCGDNHVSGDEVCDDGDEGNGLYGTCKLDCSGIGPHCGDGDCFSGKEDFNRCPSDCEPECGNEVVEPPEQCDDVVETAECTEHCTTSTCGDGYVNTTAGEACDDGNPVDDDGCSDTCRLPRRVFVSSATYMGDLSPMDGLQGLALADAHCQLLADQAARGSQAIAGGAVFRAWLSDATGSPATRFDTTYTGHYQLVDGTLVASGWAGLTSGLLIAPIDRTETGEQVAEDRVWTNTLPDGAPASDLSCAGWTSSIERDSSRYGRASLVDAKWTDVNQVPCDASHHLYCVQDGP